MPATGARISREFLEGPAPSVAKRLLGARLVRIDGRSRISGTIVETEAYMGAKDPASHAYRGRTSRNEVMFGPAGHAYVYFTMGMHHCVNVTTGSERGAGAVLLRAVQPLDGIGVMMKNRGVEDVRRLCSGPGNLTKALGIDKSMNGEDLVLSERLFLLMGEYEGEVGVSARVGVSAGKDKRWRFFCLGSPFVSGGRPSLPQNP